MMILVILLRFQIFPAIVGRMNQLLLIPSDEEAVLLDRSPRFRDCTDLERRFVVAWIQQAADHRETGGREPLSARAVGERAGIGHTKAAELAKTENVLLALREAAQANSDLTDVMGSAALDHIVRNVLARLQTGALRPESIPPKLIDVLRECKARLGLQPGTAGLILSYTDQEGNRTEAALGTSGTDDGLSSLISQLRVPVAGPAASAGERGSAESVRGNARVVDADFCDSEGVIDADPGPDGVGDLVGGAL